MKEKLEAVHGDDSRKNSVRSNVSSEHGEPRKRSEINLKVGGNLFKNLAICRFAASTSSLTISFTFFFTINTKPGDGSISQAASADDVLIATHGKGGSLAENRKLLIEQKLGGGNFRKTGSQ